VDRPVGGRRTCMPRVFNQCESQMRKRIPIAHKSKARIRRLISLANLLVGKPLSTGIWRRPRRHTRHAPADRGAAEITAERPNPQSADLELRGSADPG